MTSIILVYLGFLAVLAVIVSVILVVAYVRAGRRRKATDFSGVYRPDADNGRDVNDGHVSERPENRTVPDSSVPRSRG